jgi:hypothetical protein
VPKGKGKIFQAEAMFYQYYCAGQALKSALNKKKVLIYFLSPVL